MLEAIVLRVRVNKTAIFNRVWNKNTESILLLIIICYAVNAIRCVFVFMFSHLKPQLMHGNTLSSINWCQNMDVVLVSSYCDDESSQNKEVARLLAYLLCVFRSVWYIFAPELMRERESRFIDFICLEQIFNIWHCISLLTESVHLVSLYSSKILNATKALAQINRRIFIMCRDFSHLRRFPAPGMNKTTKHHLNLSISYGVIIYVPLSYHLGFMPVIYSCLSSISAKRLFLNFIPPFRVIC